jgi:hypothetical protein
MRKIILLLLISINSFGQNAQFRYLSPVPLTRPTNTSATLLWVDTVAKKVYTFPKVNERRESFNSGFFTKGDPGSPGANGLDGKDGTNGKDGVCPPCPSGGSQSYSSVRWVGTELELRKAFTDCNNTGYPTKVELANSFTVVDSIKWITRPIPFELSMNNSTINVNSVSGTLFYLDAPNMAESEKMIDAAPYIHNGIFKNNNGKGNCIRLSSTYMGKIEQCQFWGFKDAIYLPRAMSMEICNNRFWNGKGWYITLTYKGITGGNSSTAQPNTSSVHDNCFRVDSLSNGAILIEGGSLIPIYHNVIEGGTNFHNGSEYGILSDYGGSPNVKSSNINMNHFEVKFGKAAVKVRQNDGFINYTNNYRQYGGLELEIDNDGGYPQVNYFDQDYIVNSDAAGYTTWKGANAVWNFTGLPSSAKETSVSMWADGIIPFYRLSRGFGEGGTKYPFVRSNPAIQFNGVTIKP